MKYFFVVALIVCLISPVLAVSVNFQNPDDNTSVEMITVGSPSGQSIRWTESATGGNSYISVYEKDAYDYVGVIPVEGSPTTYAAATLVGASLMSGRCQPAVSLYDINKNTLYDFVSLYDSWGAVFTRWEVKMEGNKAYLYINGQLKSASTPLATNPYYVAFGVRGNGISGFGGGGNIAYWDDPVWSQSDNKIVLGLPESDGDKFIILDDIINDANDGLFNTTSQTQQDANYMYGTFSLGNGTAGNITSENRSINLVYYNTGTIYETQYTGSRWNATLAWNIKTNVIDAGAPDGYYATTIPGSGAYSNFIVKKSSGATIDFDSSEYSIGDLATATYDVSTDYWVTGTYTYTVEISDIYGNVKEAETLISRTGTIEYRFETGDVSGVYYAVVKATPKTGGNAVWMGIDYATITEYGYITGYVNDQNGTTISGAYLNFTQSSTVFTNATSDAGGRYTTTPFFITGTELICNVTATGYGQHNYSIVPYSTTTKNINFTLPSLSLSYSGLGISGVAMEGRLDGNVILNGYGNPISGATINVTNVSTGQSYTKYTNVAGWYLCDEGALCHLTHNVPYAIEGEKVGYTNSSIYTKIASGVL